MNDQQRKKLLLLRYPKPYSHHVFLDQDGWLGRVGIFFGRYTFIVSHRWSGKVLLNQTVWYWEHGYQKLVKDWRNVMAKWCKRMLPEDREAVGAGHVDDPVFAKDYPAIHEHLTCDWLEGAKRSTSILGVSTDGGKFKVRLADRENGMVLFVSGDGFYGALDALEGALTVGEADWRVDQFATPQGAAKRRKG